MQTSDPKKTSASVLAVALAAGLFLAVVLFVGKGKHVVADPVATREIISYAVLRPSGEAAESVAYVYKGAPLPEKFAPDEIVELRTEHSYTRQVGVENVGTPLEKPLLSSVIYLNPQYVQDGDAWYYREYATTTKSTYFMSRPGQYVAHLFIPLAHAATLTPFSSSADGYYQFSAVGEEGNEVSSLGDCSSASHTNSTNTSDTTSTTAIVFARYRTLTFGACDVYRIHLPFVTSALGSGATVTATTLHVFATAKANGVNDGADYIAVVAGDASFTGFGSTSLANQIDIGTITTSAYNVFTLTAGGIATINKTGTTNLGLREGHDLGGSITANVTGNSVTISTSEQTGTTQDPFLTITYTPGAGSAFWHFQDF